MVVSIKVLLNKVVFSLFMVKTSNLGWMYKLKVKNASELTELLTESQYEEFKKSEEGH